MSEVFDDAYWAKVDKKLKSCRNCGYTIKKANTSTGWTHAGNWEGVRCPGKLCGAEPAG